MSALASNLQEVRMRIERACNACGRSAQTVSLLAVSKTFSCDHVMAAAAAGQWAFGENYVQEALEKIVETRKLRQDLTWHFIGPIQSNKTRDIAEHFDWVHSVDRIKVAERLSAQRPVELGPLQVCLQVNISEEDTKSGALPQAVPELLRAASALPGLKVRGLMAIPAPSIGLTAQRVAFAQLRQCMESLNAKGGYGLDTLSMGMSGDLEAAIFEGATIVRIGTAIFGERT